MKSTEHFIPQEEICEFEMIDRLVLTVFIQQNGHTISFSEQLCIKQLCCLEAQTMLKNYVAPSEHGGKSPQAARHSEAGQRYPSIPQFVVIWPRVWAHTNLWLALSWAKVEQLVR